MSKFKDMVARDNARTFMNLDEFAEKRVVVYDGVTYDGEDHAGIPVVLSGLKEKDRRQLMSDHIQGLFLVSSVLHCRIQDLGGNQPISIHAPLAGCDSKIAEIFPANLRKSYKISAKPNKERRCRVLGKGKAAAISGLARCEPPGENRNASGSHQIMSAPSGA